MSSPSGYAWRKYECGVPVYRYADGDQFTASSKLILWPTAVGLQFPRLNRWEKLDSALMGFISVGLAEPHACAYSASAVLRLVGERLMARTWIDGADAAEAYEYMLGNLLGVWLGNRTPYLVSATADLTDILKKS